jgi:hypothetical protein
MELESFLFKNPRTGLVKCLLLGALLAACLCGSFALERPSILIVFSVLVAIKLTMVWMRYRELLTKESELYLLLDQEDNLVSFAKLEDQPDIRKVHEIYESWNAFYQERHVLKLSKIWHGFRITVLGPEAYRFHIAYLGRRLWYGFGAKLSHNTFGESAVLRDWNSNTNLFRHVLRAVDGSAGRGIHQLVWRGHVFTRNRQIQEHAWRQGSKPKKVDRNLN